MSSWTIGYVQGDKLDLESQFQYLTDDGFAMSLKMKLTKLMQLALSLSDA